MIARMFYLLAKIVCSFCGAACAHANQYVLRAHRKEADDANGDAFRLVIGRRAGKITAVSRQRLETFWLCMRRKFANTTCIFTQRGNKGYNSLSRIVQSLVSVVLLPLRAKKSWRGRSPSEEHLFAEESRAVVETRRHLLRELRVLRLYRRQLLRVPAPSCHG